MESLYNFLNTHSYYGLLAIILIVWAGMFSYVQSLNKKVKKFKNESN